MFDAMDPRLVKAAMKKLGIKQEEVSANKVIIEKQDNSKIIINNPQVTKVDMQGNVSFQISGNISEEEFDESDLDMIVEQTKVSKAKALETLKKNNGDLAKTILDLKK
ncbi:MAG: nascent polypeptide-associated complex protein [Candidatus Nanoarchaeia archaeon]|nr:nascent polypeptide-associated complex protein [Candidatus Nanoarchaeia archaeon]MDD5588297.1 nascent polypeptide-associated complex protein [Candidatus Nanoarchaeia archaeon]